MKKAKAEVYSLVPSAKRSSPEFYTTTPRQRTCPLIRHLNCQGSIQPCCHFRCTETIQTHKPSLSYHVPTYSWVERVHYVGIEALPRNTTSQ